MAEIRLLKAYDVLVRGKAKAKEVGAFLSQSFSVSLYLGREVNTLSRLAGAKKMSVIKRTRPSREKQIERALALLDRIIGLIEEDDDNVVSMPGTSQINELSSRAPCWRDPAIRAAILSLYGRASSREAASILLAEFGPERAPSKSSVGRIFAEIAKSRLTKAA